MSIKFEERLLFFRDFDKSMSRQKFKLTSNKKSDIFHKSGQLFGNDKFLNIFQINPIPWGGGGSDLTPLQFSSHGKKITCSIDLKLFDNS